jgi:hypothetical protein
MKKLKLNAWDKKNKKMLLYLSGVLWDRAIVPIDYVQGIYGGPKSQDSFWAKIRQNSTVRETRGYPFRYTCAGV